MVDFEPIRKVSDSGAALVRMRDDDDFVTAIDEFLCPALISIS
jgi:hypothetical protein